MSVLGAVDVLEQRGVLLEASSCVVGTFGLRIAGADSHWFGILRGYWLRCGSVAPGLLHMRFRSVAFVALVEEQAHCGWDGCKYAERQMHLRGKQLGLKRLMETGVS